MDYIQSIRSGVIPAHDSESAQEYWASVRESDKESAEIWAQGQLSRIRMLSRMSARALARLRAL